MNKRLLGLVLASMALASCGGQSNRTSAKTTGNNNGGTTAYSSTYVPPTPAYTFTIGTSTPFRFTYFGMVFELTKFYWSEYFLFKADQGARANLCGEVVIKHAGRKISVPSASYADTAGMVKIKVKDSSGAVVASTTDTIVTPSIAVGESYAETSFNLIFNDGLPKGSYTLSLVNW
jgi:hypothetical protein